MEWSRNLKAAPAPPKECEKLDLEQNSLFNPFLCLCLFHIRQVYERMNKISKLPLVRASFAANKNFRKQLQCCFYTRRRSLSLEPKLTVNFQSSIADRNTGLSTSLLLYYYRTCFTAANPSAQVHGIVLSKELLSNIMSELQVT